MGVTGSIREHHRVIEEIYVGMVRSHTVAVKEWEDPPH